jgi:HD-GYP domain-containing protein (c-di-GMP phosphodiesterase class II)
VNPAELKQAEDESRRNSRASARVALSEVLAALSHALDLSEGQPIGHTIRTCLIGMRIAEELGLDEDNRSALYYALLLKDAGCSSNAAKMSALFGSDDRVVKPYMKFVDWHKRLSLAAKTALAVGKGKSLAERLGFFTGIARTADVTKDLIAIRCERGADIVRRLGFPAASAEAVRSLDEHWNGMGYPDGLKGEQIPLLSRIANLSQTIEAFFRSGGESAAREVVRTRKGTWFDPKLVRIVQSWKGDRAWWTRLTGPDAEAIVMKEEPGSQPRLVDDTGLDMIAMAFSEIIDAKSPYTFRHSANVAAFSLAMAKSYGMDAIAQRRIHRAGLLHDIGKLGISNTILDKPGRLDDAERAAIEQHPVYTSDILSHVPAFSDFAWTAAVHHEKLDGSGYPWKLTGEQLDDSARILCVADVCEALTADRPYRAGMKPEAAFALMRREFAGKLCSSAIDSLESCFSAQPDWLALRPDETAA